MFCSFFYQSTSQIKRTTKVIHSQISVISWVMFEKKFEIEEVQITFISAQFPPLLRLPLHTCKPYFLKILITSKNFCSCEEQGYRPLKLLQGRFRISTFRRSNLGTFPVSPLSNLILKSLFSVIIMQGNLTWWTNRQLFILYSVTLSRNNT